MPTNKYIQDVQLIVEYDTETCNPTDAKIIINDKFEVPVYILNLYVQSQLKAAAQKNEENLKSFTYLENAFRDMTGESIVIKDEFHAQRIREKLSDNWREFNEA